jgi:hypothetical protein
MSNENYFRQWREARRTLRRAKTEGERRVAELNLKAVEAKMSPAQLDQVREETTGGAS